MQVDTQALLLQYLSRSRRSLTLTLLDMKDNSIMTKVDDTMTTEAIVCVIYDACSQGGKSMFLENSRSWRLAKNWETDRERKRIEEEKRQEEEKVERWGRWRGRISVMQREMKRGYLCLRGLIGCGWIQ